MGQIIITDFGAIPSRISAVRIICNPEDVWRGGEYRPEILAIEKKIQKIVKKRGYEAWILPIEIAGFQPVALKGPADWQCLEELSINISDRFKRTISRVWYLVSPPYNSLKYLNLWEKYLTIERVKLADEVNVLAGSAGRIPTALLPLGFTLHTESVLLRPAVSVKSTWPSIRKIVKNLLNLEKISLVFVELK